MTHFAVVSGTPADGFNLIGPFPHAVLATEWANTWEEDIDWWILPIIDPAKLEKERAL
jgi:hypothetical protein